jgi:integrase
MGSVFKAKVTRPLPPGAAIVVRDGKQIAEWRDAAGKVRRAPTTGAKAKRPGVIMEAATYTAKFRDGQGVVCKVATGCRTRDAAKQVLADLESRAEKVRSGVLSAREAGVAEHAHSPIGDHVKDYITALANSRGKGARERVSETHVDNVESALLEIVRECRFETLRDLDRKMAEDWAVRGLRRPDTEVRRRDGTIRVQRAPGPRTINSKLIALTAFGNWLVGAGRLVENPFERLRKLDESDDRRRVRRALKSDQFGRLLTVARLRPIAEYGRETTRTSKSPASPKSRATWRKAPLTYATIVAAAERGQAVCRPHVLERAALLGWERVLMYETMLTTGMRKKEVRSLTVSSLNLSEGKPTVTLRGGSAKNGKRTTLPLRADVADHLREWVADKRRRLASQDKTLSPESPLFRVPAGLIRILDRDLAAAGIPKVDERGRRLDVHAMRTTFNTHLGKANVNVRTAMRAMRVSSQELVLKTYNDEELFDVAEALQSLPALPTPTPMLEAAGSPPPVEPVVPIVVPTSGKRGSLEGSAGSRSPSGKKSARAKKAGISRDSNVIPATEEKRATGLEPATSSLGS